MKKVNVAVLFGGCSPEYGVSLESAHAVITHLDRARFNPVMIGISREGQWFLFKGDADKLPQDTWCNPDDCRKAMLSPDRGEGALWVFDSDRVHAIPIDAAFPVLHGRNGEDGTVQGLIALSGIPLVGCGVAASALCMDKHRAHLLAKAAGIRVPEAVVLDSPSALARVQAQILDMPFPLFVKPVKAGSSYGVTRVEDPQALAPAISLAFEYDDQVIIEEGIPGFEVGCAVMGNAEPVTGEVDEIELSQGFFDFTEKYTLKTSAIHVPARIDAGKAAAVKAAAVRIYRALGCQGFARVDMFLTPSDEIVFNEVNTIPGFTAHSRFPSMMKAAGLDFEAVLCKAIELAVKA